MRIHRMLRNAAAAMLAVTLCAPASKARAFDTGPHWDITEDVLRSEGFSNAAIQTVQCANFFVDFYEFMGTKKVRSAHLGPVPIGPTIDCRDSLEQILHFGDVQHFDDLVDVQQVAHKWDAMLEATQNAAKAKEQSGDVLGLLALLGMSLHNVQDFYAHSNWVDGTGLGPTLGTGALAKYGDHPTWLSMDRKDRENLDVYTNENRPSAHRSHGAWNDPPDSLNKDWAGRPHYDDAYICAYFATRQWVRLFPMFLNKRATWSQMQQWSAKSFDPGRDWDYSRKISMYGGHWNGNGEAPSGTASSKYFLAAAVTRFLGGRCVSGKASALRREVEGLLLTWGRMPYHGPFDFTLPSAAPESLQFVQLKVHSVFLTQGGDGFMQGQMDWYGRAAIDRQRFWSGLIDEHDQFDFNKAPYAPWTMTKAVPFSARDIGVTFQLMDLDAKKTDDQVDINPKAGLKSLVIRYAPATEQIIGDVSTADGSVRAQGKFTMEGKDDCDCGRVILSISHLTARCLR